MPVIFLVGNVVWESPRQPSGPTVPWKDLQNSEKPLYFYDLFQQTEQTKVREGKELPGQSPGETRSQPAGVLSPWNCVLQAMSYNDMPAVSPAGGAHEPRGPGF